MSRSFAAVMPDVGTPMTFDPRLNGTSLAGVGAANRALFARTANGGTITGITIEVGTSSGNISVAVYRNTGSGSAARPGTRVATSGAVACPATGAQTVALGSTVTVQPGDWLALSADNNTATFRRLLGGQTSSTAYLHLCGLMETAHPAPTSVTLATAASTAMLVGA